MKKDWYYFNLNSNNISIIIKKEDQNLTQKNKIFQTNKFKNKSFPHVTLNWSEDVIFHHSSNLCKNIIKSLKKEIDEN